MREGKTTVPPAGMPEGTRRGRKPGPKPRMPASNGSAAPEGLAAPMAALEVHLRRVEQEAGKIRAALKVLAR